MNNDVALKQLQKVFIPQIALKSPKEQRLLVLDRYKSYTTLRFIWEYYSNKIYALYLPLYTSHVLQPLDLGIFSSLKAAYRKRAGLLNLETNDTLTKKQLFLYYYQKARSTALKEAYRHSRQQGTNLQLVNIVKLLINPLLFENSNKSTSIVNSNKAI